MCVCVCVSLHIFWGVRAYERVRLLGLERLGVSVPACLCRLRAEERVTEQRDAAPRTALGSEDSRREELSPPERSAAGDPGVPARWALLRGHSLLLVIPGVFPETTFASLLFSGWGWGLLHYRLRSRGRCGSGPGAQAGEMQQGNGPKGPRFLGTMSECALGILLHISPQRNSKGTLQLHYLPLEPCWLLREWSVL